MNRAEMDTRVLDETEHAMPTHHKRRQFDPGRVWLAVAIMLLGALTAGVGVALLSWWVIITGGVVTFAGATLARSGRIMADVRVKGHRDNTEQTTDPGPGGSPGAVSISPVAEEATHRPVVARRDLGRVAAIVVGFAGLWLILAHFFLTAAASSTAYDGAVRDEFLGLFLVLAALPQVRSQSWRKGPWLASIAVAFILVGFALLADGTRPIRVNEVVVAGIVLLSAVAGRLGA